MPNVYMSLQKIGVDTKEFYRGFGCSISDVNKGTGVSRAALTRVPVHACSKESACKALEFLEKANRERYIAFLEKTLEELDAAWEQYLQGEGVLEEYRNRYQIVRKYQRLERITLECGKEVEKINGPNRIL